MNRDPKLIGHSLALITILMWGMTFISTKLLLETISPVEILFLRFAIGFIALCLLAPIAFKRVVIKHEWYFAAAGLCGVTLYFLLENIALTYTLASHVGVIVSIVPFFTAILAHFLLDGEKLNLQFFVGFAIALAGIFLISFNGNYNLKLNPLGDLLAIAAAVVWAVYSVLTKKISQFPYSTVQATRKMFFYGLIFMLPVLAIYGFKPQWGQLVEPLPLFHLIFLGLGASALCFVTWNSAVKMLGAVKTSVYIYMVPVVTVIASAIMLKENITPAVGIGTLLALAGLLLSEGKFTRGKKKEAKQQL
ncbi:EamA family transporter [Paenibacillus montaniterrae]|uniref:EamA family transporter n=1 Tax=Paenibacillus montaniterrae TaxID=429341 RepID=A0A919YRW6_9BACL|nr:DMT family transporter [Paenibacillus montaniterrae]GIP17204.1 EamA family transporter [Paenibacillus montaniterrae]